MILDCACPTTVVGKTWLCSFFSKFSIAEKRKIEIFDTQRVYRFGGGEVRPSKYSVKFTCVIGGRSLKLKTEVIDEDLPLLLGNSSLKLACAVLNFRKRC